VPFQPAWEHVRRGGLPVIGDWSGDQACSGVEIQDDAALQNHGAGSTIPAAARLSPPDSVQASIARLSRRVKYGRRRQRRADERQDRRGAGNDPIGADDDQAGQRRYSGGLCDHSCMATAV
jgi:hypothetical protein